MSLLTGITARIPLETPPRRTFTLTMSILSEDVREVEGGNPSLGNTRWGNVSVAVNQGLRELLVTTPRIMATIKRGSRFPYIASW